jgi:hypothetical protein
MLSSCKSHIQNFYTGYCRKLDATLLSESLPRASSLSPAPSLSAFDDAKHISGRVGLRLLRERKQTGPIHRRVRGAQPASMLHDSLHNPRIKTSNPCAKMTIIFIPKMFGGLFSCTSKKKEKKNASRKITLGFRLFFIQLQINLT